MAPISPPKVDDARLKVLEAMSRTFADGHPFRRGIADLIHDLVMAREEIARLKAREAGG